MLGLVVYESSDEEETKGKASELELKACSMSIDCLNMLTNCP